MINNKYNRGFSLLETLIAVLLLATAIAGPLTIASKGIQATTIARDQNTAFYLAQDAVEYVRFARDTNKLKGVNWLTGGGANTVNLTDCVGDGTNYCYVDSLGNPVDGIAGDPNVLSCGGSCDVVLKFDATNNYFSYSTGNDTIFQRYVSIINPVGTHTNEATLIVTVLWKDQAGGSGVVGTCAALGNIAGRCVTVREGLFNWQ